DRAESGARAREESSALCRSRKFEENFFEGRLRNDQIVEGFAALYELANEVIRTLRGHRLRSSVRIQVAHATPPELLAERRSASIEANLSAVDDNDPRRKRFCFFHVVSRKERRARLHAST